MGAFLSALCMIVQAVSTSRGLVNVRDEVDPCEAEVLAGMTDLERQASSLTEPAVLVATLIATRRQFHFRCLRGCLVDCRIQLEVFGVGVKDTVRGCRFSMEAMLLCTQLSSCKRGRGLCG